MVTRIQVLFINTLSVRKRKTKIKIKHTDLFSFKHRPSRLDIGAVVTYASTEQEGSEFGAVSPLGSFCLNFMFYRCQFSLGSSFSRQVY